jgi:hypothetical protein
MPGVPQERCDQLLRALAHLPAAVDAAVDLPPLASANMRASAMERMATAMPVSAAVDWVVKLAETHEATSAEDVLAAINEERTAAEMPEVSDQALVEEALADQRRFYIDAIRVSLNRMPSRELVAAVNAVVERMTGRGRKHAPLLIDRVVDVYDLEAKRFLELESENVAELLNGIAEAAERQVGRTVVEKLIARLEAVVRNWDAVAQPIQLSAMGRGLDHDASVKLATEVRATAVALFNEHDMRWAARRITAMLRDAFAEVPRLVELIEKDLVILDRMAGPSNSAILDELIRQGKVR